MIPTIILIMIKSSWTLTATFKDSWKFKAKLNIGYTTVTQYPIVNVVRV